MSTSREVDNLLSETMTSVNSHFAVATEEEILQMFAFLECVVLSPSLYIFFMLIQLFSSICMGQASIIFCRYSDFASISENNC